MVITPHSGGNLLAVTKLGGGNFAKLSSFPGFSKWQDRNLIFRPTGANIAYVIEHWPEAEWIGGAEDLKADYERERDRGTAVAAQKQALAAPGARVPVVRDYKFKRAPMAHQAKAFLLSREAPAFGLFMEQGTGKTKVIIDTACYLYRKGLIDALVVVAWPNGVHRNWVEYELEEDMTVPYLAKAWNSGDDTVKGRVDWRKWILTKDRLKFAGFNIECFRSPRGQELLLDILSSHRCLFVIDQSASIKNHKAQRTEFLIKEAAPLAPFRRIMDGAPVAEGAEELFSQFKFLDPSIIGHDTWTAFRAEFCTIGYFREITGYKNLPELRRRIDGYCYRVLSAECQDLPERIYKLWPFDLSDNEQRIFDELKTKELSFFDGAIDAEDEEVELETNRHIEEHRALVKNLRLQQISSGWWPEEGEFKPIDPEDEPSRLTALRGLLEAAPGKALIFARFRADLHLIQRVLGKEALSYHGGISSADKDHAKRQFLTNPKIKYLIGQPSSLGIGHTLTVARHVIFYANHPSLRLREECEKRAHREGQKHNLLIWDLIARRSHDTNGVRALREKKSIANLILQDPETYFLVHE